VGLGVGVTGADDAGSDAETDGETDADGDGDFDGLGLFDGDA
jgi:hypothetical protein